MHSSRTRAACLLTVSCSVQDGGSTQPLPPGCRPHPWMQTPLDADPFLDADPSLGADLPLDVDSPVNRMTDRQV